MSEKTYIFKGIEGAEALFDSDDGKIRIPLSEIDAERSRLAQQGDELPELTAGFAFTVGGRCHYYWHDEACWSAFRLY